MLERLIDLDTQVFWWINSHHNPIADWTLWTLSQGWSWSIVLVVLLTYALRKNPTENWWLLIMGIGLCFLLGDRISVMCFKDVVCRLRPCHALEGVRMFHTHCGGQYGFVSSHAANVAALAMFFYLRCRHIPRTTKRYWLGIGLWVWALAVMYSRPYLGKHYPGDVICGGLLGLGLGVVAWLVIEKIQQTIINRKSIKLSTTQKKDEKK